LVLRKLRNNTGGGVTPLKSESSRLTRSAVFWWCIDVIRKCGDTVNCEDETRAFLVHFTEQRIMESACYEVIEKNPPLL
jgi:hypothetical protein